MKRILSILAVAALAATGAPSRAAAPTASQAVDTLLVELQRISTRSICREGDKVTDAEREALTTTGNAFLRKLAANDPAGMRAMFPADLQRQVTAAQLAPGIALLAGFGPFTDIQPPKIYAVDVRDVRDYATVACPTGAPEPDMVVVLENPHEAHIQIEMEGQANRSWILTLWLAKGRGGWEVYSFDMRNHRTGGIDAAGVAALARSERAAGREVSATALYRASMQMSMRGQNLTTPLQKSLAAEIQAWKPSVLASQLYPLTWQTGGAGYGVANIDVDYDGGMWLRLTRQVSVWPSDAAVDAESRRVLDSFRAAFQPELGPFKGIEVLTVSPDGQRTQVVRTDNEPATGQRRT